MSRFKVRAERLGGHTHVEVWSRNPPGETFALCGRLVFDDRDVEALPAALVDRIGDIVEHVAIAVLKGRGIVTVAIPEVIADQVEMMLAAEIKRALAGSAEEGKADG